LDALSKLFGSIFHYSDIRTIAAGVQDKFANGSVPVKILSKLFTVTGNIRARQGKLARGLAVGEVGTPSGLRQLASMMTVAALAPVNVVGDKLVWSKVKSGFGGKLKMYWDWVVASWKRLLLDRTSRLPNT
jgi:hypothetical protein